MFRKPLCRKKRLATAAGSWLVLVVALTQLIALPVNAFALLDALNGELCGKRLVEPQRNLLGSGAGHKRAPAGSIRWQQQQQQQQQRGWNGTFRSDYGDYNEGDYEDGDYDHNWSHRGARIAAGYPTYVGEFPWFVELEIKFRGEPGYPKRCNGVIIHRTLILTVAQCLTRPAPYLGELPVYVNVLPGGEGGGLARRVLFDPDFRGLNPNNFVKPGHDLGLVELEKPLEYDEFVQPACLPPESRAPPASNESGCVLASMGNTDGDRESFDLFAMPLKRCHYSYPERPGESCYITADRKNFPGGACAGDAGAPLMCPDSPAQGSAARFFAVGLASNWPNGRCEAGQRTEIQLTDLRKQRASLLAMAQNLHDEQLRGRWRNSSWPLWWGRGSH